MCLDNGAYFVNFVGCAECDAKDGLMIFNRTEVEQDDGEEVVTYQREY